MGRNRFITPISKRIHISDGDWIEVKQELDAGDSRKQDSLAVVPVPIEVKGKVEIHDRVDFSQYEIMRTFLWLTDWSLCGPDGNRRPLTLEAVRSLDVDTFEEVNRAIFNHVMEMAAEKKTRMMQKQQESSQSPVPSGAPTS